MFVRDPFSVLGLPATLDLSAEQVQGAFLRAMATLHPDVASNAVDADPFDEAATAKAAEINLARDQVADEVMRAESLLMLRGGASVSQDKTLPDGFLQVMMQAREELDEAVERGDARAVEASLVWAKRQRGERLANVRRAFAGDRVDTQTARRELNACRYIDRMMEHVQRYAVRKQDDASQAGTSQGDTSQDGTSQGGSA